MAASATKKGLTQILQSYMTATLRWKSPLIVDLVREDCQRKGGKSVASYSMDAICDGLRRRYEEEGDEKRLKILAQGEIEEGLKRKIKKGNFLLLTKIRQIGALRRKIGL